MGTATNAERRDLIYMCVFGYLTSIKCESGFDVAMEVLIEENSQLESWVL